ncbi:MAG: helix-turn-helix domain-containing protein [Pseudomonas sp.]|nr:helix-turn-helix domain-containing protein [Pseudomonas sp.]
METMTLGEVSLILKITEHTARNRLSMGLPMPPSFRVGRRRLFLTQEVERWLAQQAGVDLLMDRTR